MFLGSLLAILVPAVAKDVIACVGDSITFGSTASDHETTSYPPNLSR
jgi:hypothetical protein